MKLSVMNKAGDDASNDEPMAVMRLFAFDEHFNEVPRSFKEGQV